GLEAGERARLERLIAAAESDDDLTAGGALGGALGAEVAGELERGDQAPTEQIRGYRLLRSLGAGGMGQVWEAEQLEPVKRCVAVKILRPGMDTGRVVARFASERQTLARMSHPAIARLYDAGLTASGRPFFSMERVEGLPLTDFCDAERLCLRDRLKLFLEVCAAVEHAHQKGVIHRDLKPTNVLVGRVDGRPAPKVIDFGIARLAEAELQPGTLLTEAGMVVGTPEYMSPEQAGPTPGDVDTRTDVYALGVLLYELLTGALPFVRRDSSPAGLVELFRELREAELPRPSRRVTALGQRAGEVAAARRLEPAGLARELRGDLDWIVSTALEKDRARRYGSVGELAEDVRRHLRHQTVSVGAPSVGYRVAKFARRHAGLLAASTAVLLALVAGLVGTAAATRRARIEAEHARTQAAIAQAVNAFLNEDLLAAVAPGGQGRDVTVREVLDTAAGKLEGRFPGEPEVEAAVRHTIGDTYIRLGELDAASPQLEQAIAMRERALGPDHSDTLEAVHALGELRFYQGRGEEAEELIRRAFEGRERALGPNDRLTVAALSDLGAVAQDRGDLIAAERFYRGAYERGRLGLGDDDPYLQSIEHNLGALLDELGRYEEAEQWLRRALEGSRRSLGAEHPDSLVTLSLLGGVLRRAERLDEAEPIYEEVYEARRRVLGEDHPSTLTSGNNLAMLRFDLGRPEEAEALERETLERQRRVLGDDHYGTLLSLGNLGTILTRLGRGEEAEAALREAVERCDRAIGVDLPLCCSSARKLGEGLTAFGRHREAELYLLRSWEGLAARYGEDHPESRLTARRLADLYQAWSRPEDAATWGARAEGPPAKAGSPG
ncbi:MAG TPA: serine/threonine-protein kinase, partial [Thermoanaerobaculia bacterium]|nr:serine/threonine-protein kinase [Thermoanaerobaculia bacterium]